MEWNPQSPTTTIKELKIPYFRGVFMRNDLPRKPLKRECGILNLDGVSGTGRGTHWVCWYKSNDSSMLRITSIALGFNLLTN